MGLNYLETNPDGTSSEFIFEEDTDKKGGSNGEGVGKVSLQNGISKLKRGRSNPLSGRKSGATTVRSGKTTKADGLASSEGSRRKTTNRQKVSSVSDTRVPRKGA